MYFNGKLTDVAFIQSLAKGVEDIRDMNLKMQKFFRDWHNADPTVRADPAFVDQSEIEIMTRLNAELRDKIGDDLLRKRFQQNVKLIRDLMHEITSRINQTQPGLSTDIPASEVDERRLDNVFATLNL